MIKFLIGGSPCTHWSIAQSKDRETTAEGIGWELFRNYLIAKEKFNPDFFLYENNKSAAPAIKDQISVELGAPLQYINSALVSAQNRQRFYCHNFGDVPQPEDRGIFLRDILESGVVDKEKAYCLKHQAGNTRDYFKKHHTQIAFEPVDYAPHNGSDIVITENFMRLQRQDPKHSTIQGSHVTFDDAKAQTLGTSHIPMAFEQLTFETIADRDKAECLRATYDHSGARNFEENIIRTKGYEGVAVRVGCLPNANGEVNNSQAKRVYDIHGKSVPLMACEHGGGSSDQSGNRTGLYAVPVRVGQLPDYPQQAGRIYSIDGKSVTLKATDGGGGAATGLYAVECKELDSEYYKGALDGNLIGQIANNGNYKNGAQPSQQYRVYTAEEKSVCVDQDARKYYACPVNADTPKYPVYRVQGGLIKIKGKPYPIKLPDGYYIIRKLSVTECCRLQTLPDDYCRAVSPTQAYKGLGNGWTAEVIMHLLSHTLKGVPKNEHIVVLSMYDGIGTGRYCFDALGYHNVTYYAYEIDKYAMQISMSNYPAIIQCGDAFNVRADSWELPQMRIERVV